MFKDDRGGFAFSCDDAKFCLEASNWGTKLSQIGKMNGAIYIMTKLLPNIQYIEQILSKRPINIFILAHNEAEFNAKVIKQKFPEIRVALHSKINAKIVFIEPHHVWISSADFGESKLLDSAVGIHSVEVYERGLKEFFGKEWKNATEI